jgi:hypothetical protein
VGIDLTSPISAPEHKLYLLLSREKGDAAHSAYNALLRRLVSFERAAACANQLIPNASAQGEAESQR